LSLLLGFSTFRASTRFSIIITNYRTFVLRLVIMESNIETTEKTKLCRVGKIDGKAVSEHGKADAVSLSTVNAPL
jgi:hypothetical protein